MPSFEELVKDRKKKRDELLKRGYRVYGSHVVKKIPALSVSDNMGKKVTVAGRIIGIRGHGKMIFVDLKDESGKVQVVFQFDYMKKKEFENVSLLHVGDIIGAEGEVFRTTRGEISVRVLKFNLLTKSTRPLPDKWHGLHDVEERYRQRYVDLLVNDEVREVFITRTKIVQFLRNFLDNHGFLEVETPILQPLYGGATAQPFTTHHNALDIDLYLRIADELYLKRLIVGGFEKVYEIGKDFRNEGIDRAHNPEFTQLEFYWAYVDYEYLMSFTERMLSLLIKQITGGYSVEYQGKTYNMKAPWKRVTYKSLFQKYLSIDLDSTKDEESLRKAFKTKNINITDKSIVGYGALLDAVYKQKIRPSLTGPVFITDHPVSLKPLAKRLEHNPNYAASFQLLIAGEEYINAYNELNDPEDQRERWVEEARLASRGLEEHQVLDEDYIRALEYGMPPTAGWGMGIDRLTMFLTNQRSIKEVILFPTLRPESVK